MRTAIVGSRTITDYQRLARELEELQVTGVISGGATGVDAMAERWARENGKPLTVIRADWQRYGKGAGPIRNHEIVKMADGVVAFWDGKSKGTEQTIKAARKAGKLVRLVTVEAPAR